MRYLLLSLLTPLTLAAQQPSKTLTLEEAIQMAQRQGPSAEAARATRDAARYRDRAFNARLLPQIRIGGNAANLDRGINAITADDGSTQFISQAQNQSSLNLSVAQKIPLTGGTLSVGSAVSRIDLFGNQTAKYWQTTPFVIGLQQDLFKPRAFVWDAKVQTLDYAVAERSYLEAKEDVAGSTAAAFFDLYAAQMTVDNQTANAAINDTLFTLNQGRFEVGKIGENELLKSELALLRSRAALDDAKLSRDRAEATLRRTISYPAGQPLSILTPDSIPIVDANPDVAVQMALKNSSITELAELDHVRSERQVTEARLGNRFNASIVASVGFNQTASAFGQAFQSPLGKQSLQLGVSMPMVQWGAGTADLQAAKANQQRVEATSKSQRDALIEDARFSVLQLQQAQRNVLISAKADTVAQKQFEVAKNRYLIGKISMLELFTAQNEKDAAVLARVQSLRTYWTAYYHLRRVTLYDFAKKQEMSEQRER